MRNHWTPSHIRPYDSLLGFANEVKTYVHTKTCTQVLWQLFLGFVYKCQKWELFSFLSTGKWISQLWHIPCNGILLSNKNKWTTKNKWNCCNKWMDLTCTMLSEEAQILTTELHTVAFILARARCWELWGWWRLDVEWQGSLGVVLHHETRMCFVCGAAYTIVCFS